MAQSETSDNLKMAAADTQLFQGWNTMLFAEDESDEEETSAAGFSLENMEEFTLEINPQLSLQLVQAPSAFTGSGRDDTGCVLWGGAVCLARWLVKHEHEIKHQSVLELGCGGGVPSLVASRLGAKDVVATDFEAATLDHVRHHVEINRLQVQVQRIDWEEIDNDEPIPTDMDVILASDVIYGVAKVPALVATIDKCLSRGGMVVMATRDKRRGVSEFLQAMQQQGEFELKDKIQYNNAEKDAPACFHSEASLARWKGGHSIHVFRRVAAADENELLGSAT